nr:MAG TPA: hypothetical protein [Caudoviricetes sp.]
MIYNELLTSKIKQKFPYIYPNPLKQTLQPHKQPPKHLLTCILCTYFCISKLHKTHCSVIFHCISKRIPFCISNP